MKKHRPTEPVSPDTYRALLAWRIQDMIDDADPNEATALLRELGMQEGLNLTRDISQAGELLADYSPTLHNLALPPTDPISPDDFVQDDDMLSAIREEVLEEWVMGLLR